MSRIERHKKMIRFRFLTTLMVFAIGICACSSGQTTLVPGTTARSPKGTPNPVNGGNRGLPQIMQLAIGVFRLEDTGTPITVDQAASMLPLWKALRSLGNSETAAAAELQAVQDQIRASFSEEQLAAIESMQLTFQDVQSLAQERGLNLGFGGFGTFDENARATVQAMRQSGQMPPPGEFGGGPGMGPGGMGAPPGGETGMNQGARQTAAAGESSPSRMKTGLPTALLDAVIDFLQAKG